MDNQRAYPVPGSGRFAAIEAFQGSNLIINKSDMGFMVDVVIFPACDPERKRRPGILPVQ
jgi:hypothetical protein